MRRKRQAMPLRHLPLACLKCANTASEEIRRDTTADYGVRLAMIGRMDERKNLVIPMQMKETQVHFQQSTSRHGGLVCSQPLSPVRY